MTLVITELSPLGIAMAADSAVTCTQTQTGIRSVTPNAAKKLQVIPHLNAGISCWGLGIIDSTHTDQWLSNFIEHSTSFATLRNFAEELAKKLNTLVSPDIDGSLGFHLAGFEDYNGTQTPSLYHIHDGKSSTLEQRGIHINPRQFNPNHDIPPGIFQQITNAGKIHIVRNGDYVLYARMFGLLEQFFKGLELEGIQIPHSQDLRDRAEYLTFQIRTMSELYRLSNLLPGIGGGIHWLTVNLNGIHSQGVRYF